MKLIITVFILFSSFIISQTTNVKSRSDTLFYQDNLVRINEKVVSEINPVLPIFQFELNVSQLPPTSMSDIKSAYELTISHFQAKQIIQTINDTISGCFATLGIFDNDNDFMDVNFDGYVDLPIIIGVENLGVFHYNIWLYSSDKNLFELYEDFKNLPGVYINTDDKQLVTFSKPFYDTYYSTTNIIVENKLCCIEKYVQESELENGELYDVERTYKLIDGELKLIEEKKNKMYGAIGGAVLAMYIIYRKK
jgi:hypothetical protein